MNISQWFVTTVFLVALWAVRADISKINKLMANKNKNIKLSCRSDSVFNSCSWTNPSNYSCPNIIPGKSGPCRDIQRVTFNASENNCNINVSSVTEFDNGNWTCKLEIPDREDTFSYTELIVIAEASVDFEKKFGTIFSKAGKNESLKCQANHSRPLGKFKWERLNPDNTKEILENPETRVTPVGEPGSGLINAEETLQIKTKTSDDDTKIICTYQQFGFEDDVVAEKSADIDLRVHYLEVKRVYINLQDGYPLNITAEIYGYPRPKVTWEIARGNDLKVNLTEENPKDEQHNLNKLLASDLYVYLSTLSINSLPAKDGERTYKLFVEIPDKFLSAVEEVELYKVDSIDFENASGDISSLAGDAIKLTCQARHSQPLGKFIWKHWNPNGTEKILENPDTGNSQVGEPGSGLFDAEETLQLELNKSDNGAKIICTYQQYGFQDDVIAEKSIDIYLNVDFLEMKQVDINLQDGSTLNITAQIYGSPRPKVTWQISRGNNRKVNLTEENPKDEQHDLEQLITSDHDVYLSTLIINKLPANDEERTYKLFVESPDKSLSAVEEVELYKVASIDFENASGDISSLAGDTIKLTCQARHSQPLGKFIWKQLKPDDPEEILVNSINGVSSVEKPGKGLFYSEETLQIKSKPSDDDTKIICTYQQYGFQDAVIAEKSIEIYLNVDFLEVKHVDINLQDGYPLNITAQIYGSPRPKVTWEISRGNDLKVNLTEEIPEDEQHNLNKLVASDLHVYLSTLIINRLPAKDEERAYKLFVESPDKSLSAIEEIELYKVASVNFKNVSGTISSIAGDTEFLTCQANHSQPLGKFIWKQLKPDESEEILMNSKNGVSPFEKLGKELFYSEETLQIESKPSDDDTKIICNYQQYGFQDDIIADKSIEIYLNVDFLEVKHVDINLQDGYPLNITTQIYGSPRPQVTWQISRGNNHKVNLTEENPKDEQHHYLNQLNNMDHDVYLSTLIINRLPVKDEERTYMLIVESPNKALSAVEEEVELYKRASINFTNVSGTISNIAGDTEFLTCQARHSRPLGKFIWKQLNPDDTEDILENPETRVTPVGEPGLGLFDAEETLQIELKPSDHGTKIICTYQQYGFQDDVIADNSIDIDLKVDFLKITNVDKNLQDGSPFNITAEIYGSPRPKVTWQIVRGNDLKVNLTEENPKDEHYNLNKLVANAHHVYISTLIMDNKPGKDEEITFKMFVESLNNALDVVEEVEISIEKHKSSLATINVIVIVGICMLILVIGIVIVWHAKRNHKWFFYAPVSTEEKKVVEPIIKVRD